MEKGEQNKNDILLELVGIRKDYVSGKRSFTALKDISICFPRKGVVSILGPSGSGKTTLLNIVGGLDHFQEGDLIVDGESTKQFRPSDWDSYRNRHVGFIFQSYNLVSTYSLEKNITLPLALRGENRKARLEKAKEVLKEVGLSEDLKKRPGELSGGQQQRVAIARALVTNPSLLLCDEPTGALDSASSEQCMALLKKLSQDRLVLLVTHNQELAEKYSDRIIKIEDGKIVYDSEPLIPENKSTIPSNPKEKVRMGFLSCLGTGSKNILLKKGRNILTAIACSIGIIGVCLVLGASNGFQGYVNDVETSVGSSVPITISPSTYRSKSNDQVQYKTSDEFPTDGLLRVYDTSYSTYLAHENKFTTEYLNYLDAILNDPNCKAYGTAMSILENRADLDFHFMTKNGDTDEVISVDASRSAGTLGSMLSSYANVPGTIIHELYGDENLLDRYYSVIKGRLPEKADEMVLVVDRYNRVEFNVLKALGILSESDFSKLPDGKKKIDFDDILYSGVGDAKYKEYKCYRNSDFYDLSKPTEFEVDCYEDVNFVIQPGFDENDSSTYDKLSVAGTPAKSTVTAYPSYYSANDFYKEDHNAIECKIVGVLRPTEESYLTLMPSSLAYRSELKNMMVEDYQTKSKILAETQQRNWFLPKETRIIDGQEVPQSGDAIVRINESLKSVAQQMQESSKDLSSLISTGSPLLFTDAIRYVGVGGVTNPQGEAGTYYYSHSNGTFLYWNHRVGGDFKKAKVTSFSDLFDLYLRGDFFNPDSDRSIINVLAYINSYSLISSISIFPTSLTAKPTLKAYLDEWNVDKLDEDTIVYSDIVGDLTDSIGEVIALISVVMVIFASISLAVSSVMTAIVSYVSVIERKKEIGVLRACGARKADVGRLFEVENALLGFASGALGIVVALLVAIPVNIVVNDLYPRANLRSIVSISPLHCLILVAIAIALALLAGLIPSRIAARKDPVECLRNE